MLDLRDELLLARLKRSRKTSARLEVNSFYAVVPSMLVRYMEEHGRSAAVYTRSEWVGPLLRNICKAINVRLVEDEGVPVLDEFLDDLIGSLVAGFPGDDGF